MKHKLLLMACACCIAMVSSATVHTILVGTGGTGMSFSPASGLTVTLGDTVKWVESSGTHTTTSTSIPGGAATWTANINGSSTSFIYVPTVTGAYNYQCNFHVSMGMVGVFTVVSATGVPAVNNTTELFTMYPNPAAGSIHLQFSHPGQPVSIIVTDINGKEVKRQQYTNVKKADLDLGNVPNGNYVIRAEQGKNIYKQHLVIAH